MVRPWRIWMLALVATASQELEKLNQLLEVAETIHAAFTNRYDVHLAELTVTEGRICATQTPVSVISRQFFEASWTTTESLSGSVEAMFNAQDRCFMKYAGLCETYAACADPLNSFDSSLVPTEGLFWAGNHTQVRAWQLEQLALLDQLAAAVGMLSKSQQD
ncbi:unnamed protein product [Durusdinium trenchii]|uniref:Secreted protein n=1 Tax=Durusdinium trenchii TaxID=1381693 RepID=A0ABP0Q0S0_9DINO